jgi:hypothetical protein
MLSQVQLLQKKSLFLFRFFFKTLKKKIRISVTSTQTTTIGLAIKNTYKAYTSDASDIDANIKIIYRKNFGGQVSYHPNYFRHPGIGGVYHGYFKQEFSFNHRMTKTSTGRFSSKKNYLTFYVSDDERTWVEVTKVTVDSFGNNINNYWGLAIDAGTSSSETVYTSGIKFYDISNTCSNGQYYTEKSPAGNCEVERKINQN